MTGTTDCACEQRQTTDAGRYEESKHKRDASGQFSTTGAAGGNAGHHQDRANAHLRHMSEKGIPHPDYPHHREAYAGHNKAAWSLRKANTASDPGMQSAHARAAQLAANRAAESEAKIGSEVNNGQFGAGIGKSHEEHEARHEAKRDEHLRLAHENAASKGPPEVTRAHIDAAQKHDDARGRHRAAHREPQYAEGAHAASKAAHEASKAATGGK